MNSISANNLADELGVTPRRVRQLADLGVLRRLPDGGFDGDESLAAYRTFLAGLGSHEYRTLLDETLELADEVQRGLAKLRKVPQPKRLAAAENGVGPLVGKLIHRLGLLAATAPDGPLRNFEHQHVEMLAGRLVGALLNVLEVELERQQAA